MLYCNLRCNEKSISTYTSQQLNLPEVQKSSVTIMCPNFAPQFKTRNRSSPLPQLPKSKRKKSQNNHDNEKIALLFFSIMRR